MPQKLAFEAYITKKGVSAANADVCCPDYYAVTLAVRVILLNLHNALTAGRILTEKI